MPSVDNRDQYEENKPDLSFIYLFIYLFIIPLFKLCYYKFKSHVKTPVFIYTEYDPRKNKPTKWI